MTYIVIVLLLLLAGYLITVIRKKNEALAFRIMINAKKPPLRDGNRALNYLLEKHRSQGQKLNFLIDNLSTIGAVLYALSENFASIVPSLDEKPIDPQTRRQIALSAFDLTLVTYFNEIFPFLDKQNEVASVLTDALLYQVTGYEATSPTEQDVIDDRTHKFRGIHKFLMEKKMLDKPGAVKDTDAWLLGKEVSCALLGHPDISMVMTLPTPSMMLRYDAKGLIREVLYDEVPRRFQRRRLQARLLKQDKKLTNNLMSLRIS
jgi:hypothetical protein